MKEKMNCYDFAMKFAFAKQITFYLTTHYSETESERTDKLVCGDFPEWETKDFDVIMVKADKKNCFTVYGFREV